MHLCVHAPPCLCVSAFVYVCVCIISRNFNISSGPTMSLLSQRYTTKRLWMFGFFFISSLCVWERACMSVVSAMLNTPIFIDPRLQGIFQTLELNPKTHTYGYMLCVRVHHCFAHSGMHSSHCMDKKSLNQWVKYGGVHARTHARTHTLAVVCVCESELSVLLSHTIHHKLLILLDHCRDFRTPRCSLKTQSEANALNPPDTHTSSHSRLLTHTHSHGDPEGTAVVLGDLASPTL